MEDFISTCFHSNLNLFFQLFDLVKSVIKFHLQIVSLKDDRFQVHLLLPNHMLFQAPTLLLDFIKLLLLLGATLLTLRKPSNQLQSRLESLLQLRLSRVRHVLHHVQLLRHIRQLLVQRLRRLNLLL